MEYNLRASRYTENMDDKDEKLISMMLYTIVVFLLISIMCYLTHKDNATIVRVTSREHITVEVGATAPLLDSVPSSPAHKRSRTSDPTIINS